MGTTGLANAQVLFDSPGKGAKASIPQKRNLVVGRAFKEVAIVTDNNQGSREGIKEVFHCSQGIRVKIVRWLIEKKNIRLGHEQAHQLQTTPLTAGDLTNPRPCTLASKTHSLRHLRGGNFLAVNDHTVGNRVHRLDNAKITELVKLVSILRKGSNLDGLSALHPAACWLQITTKKIKDRRLTCAVHADDSHSLPRSQAPGHVVKDRAPTTVRSIERNAHLFKINNVFPEACGRHLDQFNAIPGRGNVSDQGLGRSDVELWLRCARRSSTTKPGEFFRQEIRALLSGDIGLANTLGSRQSVRSVGAIIDFYAAWNLRTRTARVDPGNDFPNGLAHCVQEPTIVGDSNQCAACAWARKTRIQVARKPRNAFHIKVIRWFIQANDIGGKRKHPCKVNAATLPTRERSNQSMQVDIGQETCVNIAD